MKREPFSLSATEAVEAIGDGRLSSVDLVTSCLSRIEETDGQIKAWAHIDKEHALAQAAECDRIRKGGYATGSLHGVPVGLKDIIDTSDMPTENGTPIFSGRQPDKDARLVENLRASGAVIIGKTVTTELAFMRASQTRNPHNPDYSPGGSSSGSAAAVAANQVPLAVGTQTNGSVIRPASFCGTFGFKPTKGTISRSGVLRTSATLDQIGAFGRSLEDVALLTDAMGSYDQNDALSFSRPRPNMRAGALAKAPVTPDFAWFELPFLDRLNNDAKEGHEAVLEAIGPQITRLAAADTLSNLVEVQLTIHEYELCLHQGKVFDANWNQVSDAIKPNIERGRSISKAQYEDALAVKASAEAFFADFFTEFDAIISPASTGEAPKFGPHTGDPIFCTLWTLAGLPCVTLPLLIGENNLPIGVQLIGPIEKDDRLLRTAKWLQSHLAKEAA